MEKEKESRYKGLVVFLVCLCMVIVFLVIGIVIANNSGKSEGMYVEDGDAGTEALEVQERISDRFEGDINYSLEDAVAEYEHEITVGSNARKVYVAMNYADFVYEWYEDIDRTIDIMERVEPLLDNDELKVSYYVVMRSFYEDSGNGEKVEECNQILMSLTPNAKAQSMDSNKEGDEEQ